MGLSPKPNNREPLMTWDDLNELLQNVMVKSRKGEEPWAVINVDEYEMSVEEVIAEGEKNNYTVTKQPGGNYLKFE